MTSSEATQTSLFGGIIGGMNRGIYTLKLFRNLYLNLTSMKKRMSVHMRGI